MKYYQLILILSLLNFSTLFSQEKLIKHTVRKGETITAIAQKYKVDPSAIYELNPDCSRTLKLESIILIPSQGLKKIKAKTESNPVALIENIHEVQPKETLFGIAKQYEISLEDINNANPELIVIGLKAGQKIKIPAKTLTSTSSIVKKENPKVEPSKEVILKAQPIKNIPNVVAPPTETILHEVMPSETKFRIAKQYGISITDLDKANPILEKEPLKAGQKIIIPIKEVSSTVAPEVKLAEVIPSKKLEIKEKAKEVIAIAHKEISLEQNKESTIHEVLPKETKYGIAKKYGISVAELESQNPTIVKNLYVGAQLTILGAKSVSRETAVATPTLPAVETTPIGAKQENSTIANSLAKWNTSEELTEELIRMASDNLGTRYRSGGTSKNGFDCSGLMYSTFSSLDIKLPRSSHEMALIGTIVEAKEAKKGDLIFFKTRGGSQINHVGMVVEVNEGEIRFIHSSTQSGVIISSTKEKYYKKNFTQINRVIQQ